MTASRIEQIRIAARLRRMLAALARLDAAGPEERSAWRAARLADLRRHATARSPLYQQLHRGLGDAPLRELPTLNKDDLVDRFDEIVTDRRLRLEHLRAVVEGGGRQGKAMRRYRVGMSSASSGRPGLFPFDEHEWTALIANAARARAVSGAPDRSAGRIRSAKVGSPSRWHLSKQLPATLRDPRKPVLELSAADDVQTLADELQRWRPDVLTGYPSSLAALAEEQLSGRLDIAPLQVFAGGERLTPKVRQRIVAAWGAEPFDQYLTTEAGFLAIECPAHDGLHVLEDHVILEVVDEAGGPVQPGAWGYKVLITVLSSRTVPLIRYELGDVAALAEGPCACGRRSPRLIGVDSLPRDLLRFAGRDGADVLLHPVAVTSIVDAAPVRAWQVVHDGAALRVRVVGPESSFDSAALAAGLVDALSAGGAAPVTVDVDVVEEIQRGESGKAGLVISVPGAPSPPAP